MTTHRLWLAAETDGASPVPTVVAETPAGDGVAAAAAAAEAEAPAGDGACSNYNVRFFSN